LQLSTRKTMKYVIFL